MKSIASIKFWVSIALAATMSVANAQEPIALLINHRPPYTLIEPEGKVSGLTATVAEHAFQKAGIPYNWIETPLKRQFAEIQENRGPECAVGLLKNADREKLGQFSKPLYRDQEFVAIIRSDRHISSPAKLSELLDNTSLRLLLKDGLTYGQEIKTMVSKKHPNEHSVVIETNQMLHMIAANRADWMLATEEEAGYLIGSAGLSPRQINIIHLSDVNGGEFRYLYCSNKFNHDIMQRINMAIPDILH